MTESNVPPPSPSDPTAGTAPAAPTVPYQSPGSTGYPGPYVGPPPDKDSITMGMLCHLLAIFTFWLGPLIIWLIKREQSAFIDDQGKEALNVQIVCFIAGLICIPLIPLACIGLILMLAVHVTRLIFTIIATIQANKGVAYRYPVTFRIIK